MVSECANRSCAEKFKYLGAGKLFLANPTQGLQMSQQHYSNSAAGCARNAASITALSSITGFRNRFRQV